MECYITTEIKYIKTRTPQLRKAPPYLTPLVLVNKKVLNPSHSIFTIFF